MVLAFQLLNDTERECLRLVHQGYGSKEIAQNKGVRPDSVDKIILSARRKLGGRRRQELARLLIEHEAEQALVIRASARTDEAYADDHPQTSGPQTLGLTDQLQLRQDDDQPSSSQVTQATQQPSSSEEARRSSPPRPLMALPLVLGRQGSEENDLSAINTLATIAMLMAAIIAAAGAAVSLLFALNHLVGTR